MRSGSPAYYKISNAWTTITSVLNEQNILDPFAGAGTFMNMLVARGIPASVIYGDICYPGGQALNGGEHQYLPNYNTLMSFSLFDGLPSWYKPYLLNRLRGYITMDARQMPFDDNSFDYVVGDPPYGKNLNEGGLELLRQILPEALRVSKKGVLFLVPEAWEVELHKLGIPFKKLTSELSFGMSHFPVCFILITK